jgi:integrase
MRRKRIRRAPGAGHLFIRKTRAGEERWVGQWTAPDGRRIKRAIGPRRQPGTDHGLTRRQAENELDRLKREAIAPAPDRRDLEAVAAEHVRRLRARGRKHTTIAHVESAAKVHLVPFFKGRSVEAITSADVETFVAAKLDAGYAPKSVQNWAGILGSILEPVLAENPVRQAARPQVAPSTDIRFLTLEEVEAVIVNAPADELGPTTRALFLAAAMSGLRQGELRALRWRDVDWAARRLRVRRNHTRG